VSAETQYPSMITLSPELRHPRVFRHRFRIRPPGPRKFESPRRCSNPARDDEYASSNPPIPFHDDNPLKMLTRSFSRSARPIQLSLDVYQPPVLSQPVFGLNCDPTCILVRVNIYCCDSFRRRAQYSHPITPCWCCCVNFGNPSGVFSSHDLRACAPGRQHGKIRR